MKKRIIKAQTTIEFTFCFILCLLLFYGAVMAIRWAGVSLAARRVDHDQTLGVEVSDSWDEFYDSPLKQLNPNFHEDGTRMHLIYGQ